MHVASHLLSYSSSEVIVRNVLLHLTKLSCSEEPLLGVRTCALLHTLNSHTHTRCRDHGPREDRQKARMIWMVEELGEEKWKSLIEQYMGGVKLRPAVKVCGSGCASVSTISLWLCLFVPICLAVGNMCSCCKANKRMQAREMVCAKMEGMGSHWAAMWHCLLNWGPIRLRCGTAFLTGEAVVSGTAGNLNAFLNAFKANWEQ